MIRTKQSFYILVFSIALIFISCDFPNSGERTGTYLTITLSQPGTHNIIQTIDLNYNIPNMEYAKMADNLNAIIFKEFEYWQTKMDLDDEPLVDCFFLTPINRILSTDDFESEPIPENTTILMAFISNFGGETGDYDISKFDIHGNLISDDLTTIDFMSNQIDREIDYAYALVESSSTDIDGRVEVHEYGKIGGFVRGKIIMENVAVSFFSSDHSSAGIENYDIAVDFSLLRGADLAMNFTWVCWIYGEEDTDDRIVLVGEEYDDIICKVSEDGFLGWSLTQDGSDGIIPQDTPMVIPKDGLTLYAIWDK